MKVKMFKDFGQTQECSYGGRKLKREKKRERFAWKRNKKKINELRIMIEQTFKKFF